MFHRSRCTILKAILLTALIGGASVAMPRLASSQARGSLQVTATVVQTQGSVAGLQAAHEALIGFVATGQSVPNDVTTVAQVQVVPDAQTPGQLEVEIDYLKNRSEEHTSELQSRSDLVCRLLLEKKNFFDASAEHKIGIDETNSAFTPYFGKPSTNLLHSTHIITTSDGIKLHHYYTLDTTNYLPK